MWTWVEDAETGGPQDDGDVKRDWCYAWTEDSRRCGRSGVGWPMPGYSKVYLCHQHQRDMVPLLQMAVAEGVIDLREDWEKIERPVPHTVYRYYDADGKALYIGMTKQLKKRERAHSEKAWFTRVARMESAEYPDKASASWAEREAIALECPEFNIQYIQYRGSTIYAPTDSAAPA